MRVNASPRVTALNSSIHPTFKHPFFKSFRAREGDKKIRAGLNDIGGRYFIPIVGRGKKYLFEEKNRGAKRRERDNMLLRTVSYSVSWQFGSGRVERRQETRVKFRLGDMRKVSTKALAGAKTLGGFLYSAVNKAGKTVVEAGAKIKKTVEENRLVAELNREQEAFIANKHTEKGEAVAPWVGAPNEDILREECLSLSMDQRNFLKSPPKEVDFPWDFEAVQPMAQATLALDPNLENMRFQLVPKVISEENFWRNYFYRVSVLRQSHELNTMANQAENNLNQTSAGTVDQAEVQVTTGQESSGTVMTGSNSALADSPGHEFVSDSMRVSDTDLEEVREGMKKLGMQPPKAEEDWERELEAELKDYEVVTGNEERSSVETPVRSSGALDKDWEKQIDELLANEDDEDLK